MVQAGRALSRLGVLGVAFILGLGIYAGLQPYMLRARLDKEAAAWVPECELIAAKVQCNKAKKRCRWVSVSSVSIFILFFALRCAILWSVSCSGCRLCRCGRMHTRKSSHCNVPAIVCVCVCVPLFAFRYIIFKICRTEQTDIALQISFMG